MNVGARIEVKQTSSTPAIGSPAPRSESKTASDADALTDITTDPRPDPDLYRMTIPEALNGSEPLLVTFATPAYCPHGDLWAADETSSRSSRTSMPAGMNFIHVEVYDNPAEIREQGLSAARTVPRARRVGSAERDPGRLLWMAMALSEPNMKVSLTQTNWKSPKSEVSTVGDRRFACLSISERRAPDRAQ